MEKIIEEYLAGYNEFIRRIRVSKHAAGRKGQKEARKKRNRARNKQARKARVRG